MEKSRNYQKGLFACKIAMSLIAVIGMLACVVFANFGLAEEIDTTQWNEFMSNIINVWNGVVMPAITAAATMVLIIAGVFNFLKLKNSADEGEREKAKKAILWWVLSVVGVVAVLWATPNLISIAQGWFPQGNGVRM